MIIFHCASECKKEKIIREREREGSICVRERLKEGKSGDRESIYERQKKDR